MRFTHFTLTQGGQGIGSAATLEQAVTSAKILAEVTSESVTVVAHIAGGGSKEAIFNPDGTNDKSWVIDKGRPLMPIVGRVYMNRGGGEYRCMAQMPATGTEYYNASGGSSNAAAVFKNVASGWTFTAKGIIEYVDGTIEWDHSSDGHWEKVRECPV